jgi:hypothetical protein
LSEGGGDLPHFLSSEGMFFRQDLFDPSRIQLTPHPKTESSFAKVVASST